MHACEYSGLVYEGDLGSPKCLEPVNHLDDARADGLASDPGLVIFAIHPALLDDVEANVDDVNIVHLEAWAAGICSSGEEAEDEGSNPLAGCQLAILGRRFTILVDKPEKEINKDNIRLAEAPLLEGSMHLGGHGLKEDVCEGSFHCYNVCLHLIVSCMHCADHGTTFVVNSRGVVGHVGYLGREGRKGIRICFHGEENVHIPWSCTEEQLHYCGCKRSMRLGTAAEMKKKFNQGLKHGNSLDWFSQRWESCFHIQKGGFHHSGHD
jgi:hypothetical protein